MKSIGVFFGLLFSVGANAATTETFVDEGYYRELPAGNVPQNLARAEAASIKIESNSGHCSASFISPDGYVLTAAHCVRTCLKAAGKVMTYSGNGYGYNLYTDSTPDVTCKGSGNMVIEEFEATQPKVVFTGNGYAEFDDSQAMKIPNTDWESMKNAQGDFAILKYTLKKAATCIPIDTKFEFAQGAPVWAVGYPGGNSRPSGYGSNGSDEYKSYGYIESDISKNQYYLENNFGLDLIARNNEFYSRGGQFISNMDIYPGNSGSMSINKDGSLIGVNNVPSAGYERKR